MQSLSASHKTLPLVMKIDICNVHCLNNSQQLAILACWGPSVTAGHPGAATLTEGVCLVGTWGSLRAPVSERMLVVFGACLYAYSKMFARGRARRPRR